MIMRGLLNRLLGQGGVANAGQEPKEGALPTAAVLLSSVQSHLNAGRLPLAENACRHLLALYPNDVAALQLLGGLCYQAGHYDEAAAHFATAASVSASDPRPSGNHALALHAGGRSSEAIEVLRKAVLAFPAADNLHNLLGYVQRAEGALAEAESSFNSALAINPDHVEAHVNLGNLGIESRRWVESEQHFRRVVELRPEMAEGWRSLARCLRETHRTDAARDIALRGLAIAPDHALLHLEVGLICMARDDWPAARACFDQALALDNWLLDACCNAVDACLRMRDADGAATYAARANAIRPRSAEAMNALALVAKESGDWDRAEAICRECLLVYPEMNSTRVLLGAVHVAMGRLEGARADFTDALAFEPESAAALYALGTLQLLEGNWSTGFQLYERRFDAFPKVYSDASALMSDARRWRGESLQGRRILVWAEQGFGDFVMMLRYVPLLRQRGAGEVIVACNDAMRRLVHAAGGADVVLAGGNPPERDRYDVHVPIMSFPLAFDSTRASVPASAPYIVVPPQMQAESAFDLSPKRLSVGVCWAGSPALRDDARRSVAIDRIASLAEVPGCDLISLQKGSRSADAKRFPSIRQDLIERCDDFLDTAALIHQLDLVISVDTVVAHLAGALARPVWLLNRRESEWRWGLGHTDSAWYPTMRIFNEHASGGWPSTFRDIRQALVSWSESFPNENRDNTITRGEGNGVR